MTLDELIKMLKADDYVELTPEENKEIVEYLEYYKEQDSVIKMYNAVYRDNQHKVNELEKALKLCKKALMLACKYMRDMDCGYYHYEDFIQKAREE